MTIDCHNAMGEEISSEDGEDMLKATKSCLDSLITKDSFPIELGYANSNNMDVWTEDLAKGGLGITCLKINNKKYFVGWADANNMENGVREKIIKNFEEEGHNLLEICTSDTHYTASGARNRNGYFQLGMLSKPNDLANWYLDLAKTAESKIKEGTFEVLEHQANVKVMGPTIFSDYSKIMDKTMTITKWCLLADAGLFAISIFL